MHQNRLSGFKFFGNTESKSNNGQPRVYIRTETLKELCEHKETKHIS